jgi:hypothetical protein
VSRHLHRSFLRSPDAAYRKTRSGFIVEFYTRRPRLSDRLRSVWAAIVRWL